MIFKTITDETTLSGQKIVGVLQARKIAQQQATVQLEIDIACLKEYQVACQNGTVTTEQFDTIMHKASASAVEYSAKVKAGTGTAQSYANAQRSTNSALQEVSIGAGIASKAVKLFSTALNMIAFTAIIQGISWLIGKVDEWIVTAKEAKESANAFKQSLSTFFNETQTNLKTISSLSDRFNELSKNVDDTGKKIGGTEEEYAEFLDICQQVGQIMPELITGYTNEGEAIITLQGKVDSLTDSYKEAIRTKAALFLSNGDEEGNSIKSFFEDYNDFVNGYQGVLGLKTSPSGQNTAEEFEEYYGYDKIHRWLSNVTDATLEDLEKLRVGTTEYVYLGRVLKEAGYEISEISADNYNAVHDVFNSRMSVMEKGITDRVTNIRTAFQNMLYADSDYWKINDENVISAINSLYASIDDEFIKQNELFNQTALQTFESDFVSLFNNDATKQAMVDFYTPIADDETVKDYADRIKSSLETVQSYCDGNGITVPINFDDSEQTINNLEAQYQRAVDFAKDKFDGYDPTEFFKEHSINTQEEIDAWQKIAQGARDAAEAEKEYLNQTPKESPTLFTQLTTSKESLDKFQSSVKSAYDAYSTLLSGNYSSSDLLGSIQEISESVSEMGGTIDWEFLDSWGDSLNFIGGQKSSLELLGDVIDDVSEKYAKSVLSDAGIDVDSKFGQMLANNIIQAQKASIQLDSLNNNIDSLQNAYSSLTDIVETYNETGSVTFDQLQTLLEMKPQYLSCLTDENGQLQLNEQAMVALANQRLNDAEAQAVQQAIAELGQLALQDEKTAVQENAEAFTNAVNDLALYNQELSNTIAEATVGAAAIRDLNGAINGAESQGASDEQINTVLDNLNAKLQAIGSVRDKINSGGLGNVLKPGSKSSSKSEKDLWLEEYKRKLEELKRQLNEGRHICPLPQ